MDSEQEKVTNTSGMDDEQEKAINAIGSVAVIAGPGSGKTRILSERARISPKNSIALTFTRSAAGELKRRAPWVEASTIHSFCFKHIKKFPGDYELLLEEFLDLKTKPKYDLVLVDEAMDLSPSEVEVISSIVNKDVYLVLDPFQSIFTYAYALGKDILNFFDVKELYLHKNYRSSNIIVKKLENIHLRQLIACGKNKLDGTFVLLRTNNQLNRVAYALSLMGYNYEIKRKGQKSPVDTPKDNSTNITLMTIHVSKGMECKKVIIFDWGERYYEKNLEYVAVARASEEAYLINSIGELTVILGKPAKKKKDE